MTCLAGPCAQVTSLHTYDVDWDQNAFTGTGSVSEGSVVFEETITGELSGNKLRFEAVYTTVVPGYTITGEVELRGASGLGTGQGVDPRGASQDFGIAVSDIDLRCLD